MTITLALLGSKILPSIGVVAALSGLLSAMPAVEQIKSQGSKNA